MSDGTGSGTTSDAEQVRVEVSERIATIRLDRPTMNPLNAHMQELLRSAALEVTERDDVRAVVLYGGERVFAAGADIKEMARYSYTQAVDRATALQSAFTAIAEIPKPVIAAINGFALGAGCELALTADFRVCAEDAKLGQPEILLGIIPGAGGSQRLPRLVGPARAKDLIYSGRFVAAAEALAMGLVDRVVPAADVYAAAREWAATFVDGPAYAYRAAKVAIDAGLETDLGTGLALERTQFASLFATEDRGIGMRSFIENGPGKAEFVGH